MYNEGRQTESLGLRTWIAIFLTSIVVVMAYAHLYLKAVHDKDAVGSVYKLLLNASVADFGQWLSGIAAALAFIWLIFAYFQQSEELSLQRVELSLQRAETKRLADEAGKQSIALQTSASMVERDIAMRLAEVVKKSVETSGELIVARIRLVHGKSPRVEVRPGSITFLTLPTEDAKISGLTYLLAQLERSDLASQAAWSWVLGETPTVSNDIGRIEMAVTEFEAAASKAGILSIYERADFMRLAKLLSARLQR
ncbi:MAG: hypothetical protein AAB403_18505 [Planctomycetota bacterium]